MTTVYLVRHAEAEGNVYRRYHGWYNSLITENGYRQIEKLKERFEQIRVDAVYSSDRFRTMTTAAAIYKPKGLPLVTDPDLREICGGVWEDRSWGRLHRENGESLAAFNRADINWKTEGSETYEGVQKRVVAAILRLAAAHDGQTIAIVAHGTAIRRWLIFPAFPPSASPTSPTGTTPPCPVWKWTGTGHGSSFSTTTATWGISPPWASRAGGSRGEPAATAS